jgi:hypothetical protein
MLTCTILTFAMCADPNVSAAITFGDLTVPIVWSRVATRSCMDVGGHPNEDGAGFLRFETAWDSQQNQTDAGYSGRIVVRISNARIELNAFSWQRMSRVDAGALKRMYAAELWHELGHLRTAKATVDAINAGPGFSAASAADYTAAAKMRGDAAEKRILAEQADYDRAAAHGIQQSLLASPLAGPDTVVVCSSGRG